MVRVDGEYLEVELADGGTRYVKKTLATLEEVRDKLGMGDCPWLTEEIASLRAVKLCGCMWRGADGDAE